MYSIHDEEKVKEILIANNIKPFRYAQIENSIYKNYITNFDDIVLIPKEAREVLKNNFFFNTLEVETEVTSSNWQTTKILFKTNKWEFIESVIMRHLTWRNTLCISCQVWCPMKCSFCATWKLWLKRNLEFHEIVEQIMYAAELLNKDQAVLRNVVYMWMWEPFLNYENVKKSINIVCAQKKLNLANRRITISSCWIIPWIKKFWDDFPQTSLAISLHAPNDEVRSKIMPVDHTYPVADLMDALDEYTAKTNKRIFYEYIMINWVNDNIKLAYELAKLLKWKLAHVNFIPYNAWEWDTELGYTPTPRFIIEKFQKVLDEYWIPSTIRATMWDDIDAACGQLANTHAPKDE